MSGAARSVIAFGIYLLGTSGLLVFAPNLLLGMLGMAPAADVWIRVLGVLVAVLGTYYVVCGRANLAPFMWTTVWVRLSIPAAFGGLVLFAGAPPQLVGFAVIDAVGAVWTWRQLRANDR